MSQYGPGQFDPSRAPQPERPVAQPAGVEPRVAGVDRGSWRAAPTGSAPGAGALAMPPAPFPGAPVFRPGGPDERLAPMPAPRAPQTAPAPVPAPAPAPTAAYAVAGAGPAPLPGAPTPPMAPSVPSAPTVPAGMHIPAASPTPAVPAPAAAPTPPVRPAAPAARTGRLGGNDRMETDLPLDDVLREMVRIGASDVHLTSGAPPMVRVSGALYPLEGFPSMGPDELQRVLYAILTQRQREAFEAEHELDVSYAVRGLARFRVNIYQQRESMGAALRLVPYEIKPLEELGIPPVVSSFAGLPRGLVLVTGPTGSGKSTTLASIIDLANRTRQDHIMTVEDPIEFLHRHKKCIVNQREVGQDTLSFGNALKHVLRQDPDIILVGEMRDLETISVALTAAETGHLVFATLHTQDAAQTVDRIIDVFPAEQQAQVRTQLAGVLQGVVCQTLCRRAHGQGRVVATEVLLATPAIRNLIREGKTHQIPSSMQAGAKQGMHTLDQHLAELVRTGKITYEVGVEKCHHIEDFNRLTGRTTTINQGQSMDAGGMR